MADAGFGSEPSHRRDRVGVASAIPTLIGRPADKTPGGPHPAAMGDRFAAAAA